MSSGGGHLREVVAYDNCRDLTHAPMLMQCFTRVKVNFEKKNLILPFEKFQFLVLARNTIMLPHLICQLVAYRRLKIKENFNLLAIKVVLVAYERWSLTRGSKDSDLTCKLLVFWKTSLLQEVTRGCCNQRFDCVID